MNNLLHDIKFSVRMFAKRPGFTLVAIITLALGIGANTAIFSVVNEVLFTPLPYPNPDRIIRLFDANPTRGWDRSMVSYQNLLDWREQNQVFDSVAAFNPRSTNITGGAEPQRVAYSMVTADFFKVLGVEPILGRTFLPEEDQPGVGNVVVLSHGFWKRYFGGDTTVTGKTIVMNDEVNTIVGVMPAQVRFPLPETELWKPIATAPDATGSRGSHWLSAIARLKPGVTIEQAQAEMNVIAQRLEQQYPNTNTGLTVEMVPLNELEVESIRPALLLMWGAVGLVLLIGCANVANLLLARAVSREREIAIRSALGAGRARLLRQLLTESLILSLSGGLVGVILAFWSIETLSGLGSEIIVRDITLDSRILIYSFALSLVTGIVFGLIPALKVSKTSLSSSLKESGRSSGGVAHSRASNILVVGEIALTLVLLVGAGLLIRSFVKLLYVDTGFDAKNLLTTRIAPPQSGPQPDESMESFVKRYLDAREKMSVFYGSLLDRVRALPGVESAGAVQTLPLAGNRWAMRLILEGRPADDDLNQLPSAIGRVITPGYFESLRIPLLQGRVLAESDNSKAQAVAVINHTLADAYWPGENPIGKRVKFGKEPIYDWITIVGLVGDVRYSGMESVPEPTIYVTFPQATFGFFGDWGMTLTVKAKSNPALLVAGIRNAAFSLDSSLPFFEVRTMEEIIGESVAQRRFSMLLIAIFATLALALAVVGIYGVISYSVSQRTRELGIRIALGANRRDILKLVMGQGMLLICIGAAIGLAAALAATRLLESLLYEVSTTDMLTFIMVVSLVIFVAIIACYIPARRAMRADPMTALRYE